MPVAPVNGQSISYEDSGGEGLALLFSHGYLMDHRMFDPQVAALADRRDEFRCIRWDQRGFGGTAATEPFTYWDSADDAIGLLDELGIEQAVLVGMSQGGFLSLRAALTYPERVAALVLIDTQAGVEDDATRESYLAMQAVVEDGSQEEFEAVLGIVGSIDFGDDPAAAPWIEEWKGLDRATSRFPFDALVDRDDITDRLGEITCPALVIHGTADMAIPIERAHVLVEGLPYGNGPVEIEGAPHTSNMTHPDLVNPHLIVFLDGLDRV